MNLCRICNRPPAEPGHYHACPHCRHAAVCQFCFTRPAQAREACNRCRAILFARGVLTVRAAGRRCQLCDRPAVSGTLCRMHDMRQRRHGDPLIVNRRGPKPRGKAVEKKTMQEACAHAEPPQRGAGGA